MIKMGKYNRIVIKIGSSSLTHNGGKLNLGRIDRFLRQMVDLKNQGKEVIFVSSGAIGAGMAELGLKERPGSIPEQQGIAAVGQALIMGVYNKFLREYGQIAAQILLTASDLENRERYLNAYNTLESLLRKGIIPIINENDTVATQEIKFGDNDTLSARVAGLVEADLLIILSDIEGMYNGDPRQGGENLKLINKVTKITPELRKIAGGNGSLIGTGGMQTKLQAAEISIESGITMVIGPGFRNNIINDIVTMLEEESNYNIGTTFIPISNCLSKRKQWLLYNQADSGRITVDSGAAEALLYQGKSLLPGGITKVKGSFKKGDSVLIMDESGEELAKGLVNYSSGEVELIKGYHSGEIVSLLGYENGSDVIHRDNMVIKGGIKNGYQRRSTGSGKKS
ncbi:MAG: glutamate 5-kinase [Firmicutes bacterium]|nr:glutamate 5-kinase [Bacillota bacterium]